MKIFGWEFGRAKRYAPQWHVRSIDEVRTRSATQRFTFGDVQVNIYAPFDDETGKTVWRFSLIKLVKQKDGESLYRRSFDLDDVDDLHRAVDRCAAYISRAITL